MQEEDYFTEGRQWYLDMFFSPLKHARHMVFIFLCCVVSLFIGLGALVNLFPLVQKVTIVAPLKDTIAYRPKIAFLDNKNKSTKEAVINYLCTKYVIARESYERGRFDVWYKFVLQSSAKNVFDTYYANFALKSNTNTNLIYKAGGKSIVNILHVTSSLPENLVQVKFTKTILDYKSKIKQSKNYLAKVGYYMPQYNFNKSTTQQIDFKVKQYEVTEIIR